MVEDDGCVAAVVPPGPMELTAVTDELGLGLGLGVGVDMKAAAGTISLHRCVSQQSAMQCLNSMPVWFLTCSQAVLLQLPGQVWQPLALTRVPFISSAVTA